MNNKRRSILILILLLILVSFWVFFKKEQVRIVEPKVSALEEFRYLFIFNAYPDLDSSRASNFTISLNDVQKIYTATFDYLGDFNKAKYFFKTYLSSQGYQNIIEERLAKKTILKGEIGGKPLSITIENSQGKVTKTSLNFMAKYITRAPLND